MGWVSILKVYHSFIADEYFSFGIKCEIQNQVRKGLIRIGIAETEWKKSLS